MFSVGTRIRYETPEVGRRTYRPKRSKYSNEDMGFLYVYSYAYK